ncbi:energy transducer TonB [Panacibacter ginsenosidivorans]|uniref:Energy transducer TonB n=1 Tax=Panacibacter ginsenosidivorans TaxID=1813871 RepID=A0A5B8V7R0_9BACT|nr:energy transducer TonB [Panacibacter ginsenosidivorans]QEC67527.1 energy transducer TonB [Panacibacter ginsenosidivorans]
MEANKILNADLLDIIFEGRNKAYGAYDLRNTYSIRIRKAMIGMGVVCLVFTTGILLASSKSKEAINPVVVTEVNLSSVKEKDEVKPVAETPKPKLIEAKTIAVTIPKIVPDDLVKEPEVPTDDQIENVTISNVTKDGEEIGDAVAPLVEKEGTGKIDAPIARDEPSVYTKVQIEAQFPGGIKEWSKFLERTLNTDIPVENGAPAGRYTVEVSFIVDREGNVSEIQALNDPGYGIADEAVKVIKKSKQWIPAIQNGNKVMYRQTQSITFIVNEG